MNFLPLVQYVDRTDNFIIADLLWVFSTGHCPLFGNVHSSGLEMFWNPGRSGRRMVKDFFTPCFKIEAKPRGNWPEIPAVFQKWAELYRQMVISQKNKYFLQRCSWFFYIKVCWTIKFINTIRSYFFTLINSSCVMRCTSAKYFRSWALSGAAQS